MRIAKIEITDDGDKITNDFMNNGFSPYELIGIFHMLIDTITKRIKEQSDGHQS